MPFGSVIANAKEIELSTADEKTVKIKGVLAKTAIKILGIPHLGMRLRARFIMRQIGTPSSVLDVGCGPGIYTLEIARKINGMIVGIDIDQNKISQAKKLAKELNINNVQFEQKDAITALSERRYDLIICSDVLEHIQNDKEVAQKMQKALNDKGRIIITSPTKTELNERYRTQFGHYREYTKSDIEQLFQNCTTTHYEEITRTIGTLLWKLNRAAFSNKFITVITWLPIYALTYIDTFGKGMSQVITLEKKPSAMLNMQ
jgi:2-polyprenyl-3-methyl-5-hydroxy-6-metoxy-1,4-benzoquinol methylase